jgi:hypothetical protein
MSFFRASFVQPESRSGGKLASFLITAVAVALALGSSTTAIAGESSLSSSLKPLHGMQDDARTQDSDGDGLTDRLEIQQYRTNPLHQDSDRDGVTDGDEAMAYRSNPLNADTDGDGLIDGDEVRFGTDLLIADTDGDGLTDGAEIVLDADPFAVDSDGDGLLDGLEATETGTSPVSMDSDGDGLTDSDEVSVYNTNPAKADTIRVFTWSPSGTEGRVPTTSASSTGRQRLQVTEVTSQPIVSRIPLAPARFMPVLQVMD